MGLLQSLCVRYQNGERHNDHSPQRRPTGGEGGIRTHGALFRLAAFRERYHKPLGHLSTAQYNTAMRALQGDALAMQAARTTRYQGWHERQW